MLWPIPNKYKHKVIIVILAFLLIILLSHPQIFITDEWITANQLAQIDKGHQFTINEAKFGVYPNKTPVYYFQTHKNILGYPIFLPILSLPLLKLITFLGDTVDYWIITLWTLFVIFLAILIRESYPLCARFKMMSWTSILIILAFLLFLLNLIFYVPFYISSPDAPREVAAIVLTNNILFIGTAIIIYSTLTKIFREQWLIFLGMIVCLGSSSYLIWASNTKDHMLQVFLFSLVLFLIISYLYTRKSSYWIFSFLFVGLLAWDRPEMGIPLFFGALIILGIITIRNWGTVTTREIFIFSISPIFTFIGAIPLLVNNYLVTGNPFIVMYASWWGQPNNIVGANLTVPFEATTPINQGISSVNSLFLHQVTPNFSTLLNDLFKILFMPENGGIGIFILAPLFLMGLFATLISYPRLKNILQKNEVYSIIVFAILISTVFMSFAASFDFLYSDSGILPDMRYLCPIYLPLNIIGLIILSKIFSDKNDAAEVIRNFMISLIVILPITGIFIFTWLRDSANFLIVLPKITTLLMILVLATLGISTVFLFLTLNHRIDKKYFLLSLGILIALPLIWQLSTIFLIYSLVAGAEGYTFWLPIMEKLAFGFYKFTTTGIIYHLIF